MRLHNNRKRKRALSTAVGTLIFVAAAMTVFASFNLIEVHSGASIQAGIFADNLLDRKSGEEMNASWVSQRIMATNSGGATAIILDIASIDPATGSVTELIPESIAIPQGSTATICNGNSGCPPFANSKTGLITSLGNIVWVASPGSKPAFDISLGNASSTTIQGGSNATTVTLTSINGYNSKVMLYAENPPAGVNITFVPQIFTPASSGATASMILTLSDNAPAGNYFISVFAKGADGATNSSTYALTVP
ncbi:MAG: hypothetical protein JRN20_16220 [Nitrososphaerota archaeon]|nr:hypothetical protein [Nitrososphaerota archaeon]